MRGYFIEFVVLISTVDLFDSRVIDDHVQLILPVNKLIN